MTLAGHTACTRKIRNTPKFRFENIKARDDFETPNRGEDMDFKSM
jgi:hypothetical protein